jgi:hypothetical protein
VELAVRLVVPVVARVNGSTSTTGWAMGAGRGFGCEMLAVAAATSENVHCFCQHWNLVKQENRLNGHPSPCSSCFAQQHHDPVAAAATGGAGGSFFAVLPMPNRVVIVVAPTVKYIPSCWIPIVVVLLLVPHCRTDSNPSQERSGGLDNMVLSRLSSVQTCPIGKPMTLGLTEYYDFNVANIVPLPE